MKSTSKYDTLSDKQLQQKEVLQKRKLYCQIKAVAEWYNKI